MVHRIPLDEAQEQLTELINAAVSGETVVITKSGDDIVQLVPVSRQPGRPQFGSGAGLITMADDFDDPLPDFEPYMS